MSVVEEGGRRVWDDGQGTERGVNACGGANGGGGGGGGGEGSVLPPGLGSRIEVDLENCNKADTPDT